MNDRARPAPSQPPRLSPGRLLALAALLVAPAAAVWRLAGPSLAPWLAGWAALASLATLGAYAWDKRRARAGEWRTPEATLHLWELVGGWPGGFLARPLLRHKSAKTSFRAVSGLIVFIYQYIAIDALLGWRMARALLGLVAG